MPSDTSDLHFDETWAGAYRSAAMTRVFRWVLGFGLLMAVACGASTRGARSADDEDEGAKKSHDDPSWYDSGSESSDSADSSKPAASSSSSTSSSKKKSQRSPGDPAEPTFKEGMSVNDAINAIPQGYERITIEQEALDQPLLNPEFYKACKLAASQHFTIKFAVWDGRAVGIDIKSTPANKNAESCLLGLVKANVWRDKVRSLNISIVQF
jgi:hypothetical protein